MVSGYVKAIRWGHIMLFLEEKFTEEELALFKKRQENGYNITTDARYNMWLKQG